jgi:hypothetical protein
MNATGAGRVLRDIGIDRKHHRDRLADIAYVIASQHELPVGRERLEAHLAKVDRRQFIDVGDGPDCDDAVERGGLCGLNTENAPKRDRRTHDAHVELLARVAVGRERACAEQQRTILDAPERPADIVHGRDPARNSRAAIRTALTMF